MITYQSTSMCIQSARSVKCVASISPLPRKLFQPVFLACLVVTRALGRQSACSNFRVQC
ncbi:hypothetical protein N431DRAFT_69493 [Stipitochalara longipes BDJ]|nr:hypothetical protein N431DRAFT_69493 [Stipitochalara longipes BDJ]